MGTKLSSFLRTMPTMALSEVAIEILEELKERYQKEAQGIPIEFIQSRDCLLCTTNGVPLDRPEWFHLPFLREYSRDFQPVHTEKGNKYRSFLKEGQEIMVRNTHTLIKVGGANNFLKDTDGTELVKGPFSIS